MRSLLVMGIPYQHAPEVSIVRTDTCLLESEISPGKHNHGETNPGNGKPAEFRDRPFHEDIMKLCDVIRKTGFAIHPEKGG
jgi:hypothetical protein